MHLITGKHIPRRTFMRGMGATVALPFLDAMLPAGRMWGEAAKALDKTRLVCIEMVHGAAGCARAAEDMHLWEPVGVGRDFDLSLSSMAPLEPYRDYLTVISDTDVRMAEAYAAPEIGGDHFRASSVFLTQSHPRRTEGSDVFVGKSLDQMYADRFGQDTPIPSMQLCIENVAQSGGCMYGYSCIYTDSISWESPERPLPMIRDPRIAFEQIFGAGSSAEERETRLKTDVSLLDWIKGEVDGLNKTLGATDRQRMDRYLENIREIERRIERVVDHNTSGETREIPEAPAGVPDSFEEHVRLMFDLQAIAFETDMTRVFTFKMGRDASNRVYPGSGTDRPFHAASHHGDNEEVLVDLAAINKHHVGTLTYLFDRLKDTMEGDANLLDKTLILYGSPMSDSNVHNHRRCPLFLVGGANGLLEGGVHIKAKEGTPMANVMLSLMQGLGLDDMTSFGDSVGGFSFSAPQTRIATQTLDDATRR